MSSKIARNLVPGKSFLKMTAEPPKYLTNLAEAVKGKPYTAQRKFIALRSDGDTMVPDLLTLTVTNDVTRVTKSYYDYKIMRNDGRATTLRTVGFTQLPNSTIYLKLEDNEADDANMLAMIIRLAD